MNRAQRKLRRMRRRGELATTDEHMAGYGNKRQREVGELVRRLAAEKPDSVK